MIISTLSFIILINY